MDLDRYLGRKKTPKITENQDQGEQDESLWRADEGIEGGEVTNRHIGHDHETKRKNHLTNTYRNITVENKSSPTAPIRPLQKKFARQRKAQGEEHMYAVNPNPNELYTRKGFDELAKKAKKYFSPDDDDE